jgi:ribosome-binding protein aMBF1 (putative translation factor)
MTDDADRSTTIRWSGDTAVARRVSRAMTTAECGLLRGLPELVATEIRDRRKRAGMTQSQLALKVGVTRYTIASWERAETIPSNNNLTALEDALENAETES